MGAGGGGRGAGPLDRLRQPHNFAIGCSQPRGDRRGPLGMRPKVRVALTSASGQGGGFGRRCWTGPCRDFLASGSSEGMTRGSSSPEAHGQSSAAVGAGRPILQLWKPLEALIPLQESRLQLQKKALLLSRHLLRPQRPDADACSLAHPASVLWTSRPLPVERFMLRQETWSLVPAV